MARRSWFFGRSFGFWRRFRRSRHIGTFRIRTFLIGKRFGRDIRTFLFRRCICLRGSCALFWRGSGAKRGVDEKTRREEKQEQLVRASFPSFPQLFAILQRCKGILSIIILKQIWVTKSTKKRKGKKERKSKREKKEKKKIERKRRKRKKLLRSTKE